MSEERENNGKIERKKKMVREENERENNEGLRKRGRKKESEK